MFKDVRFNPGEGRIHHDADSAGAAKRRDEEHAILQKHALMRRIRRPDPGFTDTLQERVHAGETDTRLLERRRKEEDEILARKQKEFDEERERIRKILEKENEEKRHRREAAKDQK